MKVRFWVAILAILFCSCGGESLESRLDAWNAALSQIPSGDESVDVAAIAEFLEPSAVRDARAQEYYDAYANPDAAPILEESIDEIIYSDDKDRAMVRYGIVYDVNGERLAKTQMTTWIKKNGVWYRSIQ